MTLENKTKEKRKYNFSPWNVAMAMIHVDSNIEEIFPKAKELTLKDMYLDSSLRKEEIHLIY